jgi:hypothetical protein
MYVTYLINPEQMDTLVFCHGLHSHLTKLTLQVEKQFSKRRVSSVRLAKFSGQSPSEFRAFTITWASPSIMIR